MVIQREEDPWPYEASQLVFKVVLLVADLFGIVVFALLLTWIIQSGKGLDWNTGGGLFNTHVLCMAFFMIFLQGNGSIVYRLLPTRPKYVTKLIHAGIHFIVCIGITFGFVAIIENKKMGHEAHFTSLHSWIGLATICCYYAQFIFGFFMYLYPSGPTNAKIFAIPIHKLVGRSLFLFAVTTCVAGIMEVWNPRYAMMFNFAGLFAVIYVAAILYLLSDYVFRRRPPPFPHTIPGSMGQAIFYGSTSGSHGPVAGTSRVSRYEKVVY